MGGRRVLKKIGRFCDNIVIFVGKKCLKSGTTFLFIPDITMKLCALCGSYGKTWKKESENQYFQEVSDTIRSFGKIF